MFRVLKSIANARRSGQNRQKGHFEKVEIAPRIEL
jgi:hypothetical protein